MLCRARKPSCWWITRWRSFRSWTTSTSLNWRTGSTTWDSENRFCVFSCQSLFGNYSSVVHNVHGHKFPFANHLPWSTFLKSPSSNYYRYSARRLFISEYKVIDSLDNLIPRYKQDLLVHWSSFGRMFSCRHQWHGYQRELYPRSLDAVPSP